MAGSVDYEIDGQVGWIRLNRPRALNAISREMRDSLDGCLDMVESERALRAVVVTGVGKAFSAGSDIREFKGLGAAGSTALSGRIAAFHDRLARLPIPVIAAINGLCLGGGLELALACDLRLAAAEARIGFPEPRLGVTTGGGGVSRLAHLVGSAAARHLALTGEIIGAARALELGIVSKVAPPGRLEHEVRETTAQIEALSPFALSQIKRVLSATEQGPLRAAIDAESEACAACFSNPDIVEGLQAFLDKRPPRFAGARPAERPSGTD